jgi:hypothetical protein
MARAYVVIVNIGDEWTRSVETSFTYDPFERPTLVKACRRSCSRNPKIPTERHI